MSASRPANHLRDEKSPYLQQHVHNPVDWYPWGEEAFARARAAGRPIFLSIGYATCHWCHVMERESFEDERIAALLNADYVPIKVDREERPDVDRLYMTAMQAAGLGGGWPLNVFLTPGLEPFYGGTYFPPEARHGRPGLLELLPHVAALWRERRDELVESGRQMLGAIAQSVRGGEPPAAWDALIVAAAGDLVRRADREEGGFGGAPKFPTTANLALLLRRWAQAPGARGDELALVRLQLDRMRERGIHDHLGGGFHRYAVDRHWIVSHFEKMLYDQAQIAVAYLEAFQATGEPAYAATARGVFDYVARDLTLPGGGFASAEDADSEGEEGRFYVWTPAGLAAVLGEADAALFAARYGVTPEGNFEDGRSVLFEARPVDEVAREAGIEPAELGRRLADARARLLAARARRVRPLRDDKVLAAWNGLMISALARGARVLDEPSRAAAAARAAEFAWRELFDESSGALARRWRDGEAKGEGQLDDYAFLARGLLDLFQATGEPLWLERALRLAGEFVARFADPEEGAFFESPAGDASVRVRMKDVFDGAELAGNSVAIDVLWELAALCDRDDWRAEAKRALDFYAGRLAAAPLAMPYLLCAMARALAPPSHVVIAGAPDAPATRALLAAHARRFRPFETLVPDGGGDRHGRLTRILPWVAPLAPQGGRATAFLCADYACERPVTDPLAWQARLEA